MKIFFKTIFIILFVFTLSILAITLYYGYSSSIDIFMALMGRTEEKDAVLGFISGEKFVFMQVALSILLLLQALLIYKSNIVVFYIGRAFYYIWTALKNVFSDLKTKNALFILAIPFISSVYFAFTIPVSVDEAATYLLFTVKPFYSCMLFYPYPNNHILYSILTNITECFSFFGVLFSLRIPAILSSFFCWAIAYSFIRNYYSEKTAMFVVGISAMLFRSVYYSFMSRGYALMVLFFIISLYAAYNIVKYGNRKKDWMFFTLSGILGCYTIPSFLYPFATVNFLLLVYNYKHIKKQLIFNVIAGIGTLILYTPIIFINGIDALTNNPFVKTNHRTRGETLFQLPAYMNEVLQDLFWIFYYPLIVIMIITIIYLIMKRDKNKLTLWLVFCLSPFLLLVLHNVIPFYRILLYYEFAIVFLIGISWNDYIKKIPGIPLLIFLILFQIIGFIHFKKNIAEAETFNTSVSLMNKEILEDDASYNLTYSSYYYNFLFEFLANGYDFENIRYEKAVGIHVDADTINDVNYVIIDVDKDQTKKKKPVYQDSRSHVYRNKTLSITK